MKAEKITAVLIDDEEHCTETLQWMLEQYCPNVNVVAVFNFPAEALKYLLNNRVDVIFLDVEMPVLNAFDMLKALGKVNCDVIFTTAYDEFAIKAIKHNALDYLLKPIGKEELLIAVSKVSERTLHAGVSERIDQLLDQVTSPNAAGKIAIATREGLDMVDVDLILYAKADDNYAEIHLEDGTRKVVSRTLKDVERDLPSNLFIRVHQSYLVALGAIDRYVRGAGGYIVLGNGDQIPVSRARKEELLKQLAGL